MADFKIHSREYGVQGVHITYGELVDFMARLNSQIFDDPLRTVDQHSADFHSVSPDLPAIKISDEL